MSAAGFVAASLLAAVVSSPVLSGAPAQGAAAPAPAPAREGFVVDRAHSEVSFQVRYLVTKVRGRFTDFDGTFELDRARPEASTAEFRVRTASIDTDHERRDNHLRSADFFDAANHPEITFRSSRIVARGNDRYDVTGTLTMRGVAKEITLPVAFLGFARDGRGNQKAGFETSVTLNRKDYGISWNQALDAGGFVLGDDVTATVVIAANKRAPAAGTD